MTLVGVMVASFSGEVNAVKSHRELADEITARGGSVYSAAELESPQEKPALDVSPVARRQRVGTIYLPPPNFSERDSERSRRSFPKPTSGRPRPWRSEVGLAMRFFRDFAYRLTKQEDAGVLVQRVHDASRHRICRRRSKFHFEDGLHGKVSACQRAAKASRSSRHTLFRNSDDTSGALPYLELDRALCRGESQWPDHRGGDRGMAAGRGRDPKALPVLSFDISI